MAKLNRRTYYEMKLPFDGDPLETAILFADAFAPHDQCLLYERGEEIMLALGAEASLRVCMDKTVLSTADGEQHFANADLSNTIWDVLAQVSVEDWRAYGTADFELARCLHGLDVRDTERPLMRMFVPKTEAKFRQGSILLRALETNALDAMRVCLDSVLEDRDGSAAKLRRSISTQPAESTDEDIHDATRYMDMVTTALEDISAHRYRKVILSRSVPLSKRIDLSASYFKARRANTPARSFLLRLDGIKAAGLSPETLVEVYDRQVHTTPLAGTRAILSDITETLLLREELVSDSKEIAEHAISVYLSFDEMTMVCDPETVCVSQFMLVAPRGTVQHLASRVRGELLDGCNPWHAFCALFPAVTATGVPKRQAIAAIERLESSPRRLYGGCVFVSAASGMLDAALVLRTVFQEGGQTWLQAGAGIMNMSKPARELEETREKLCSFSNYLVTTDGQGGAT